MSARDSAAFNPRPRDCDPDDQGRDWQPPLQPVLNISGAADRRAEKLDITVRSSWNLTRYLFPMVLIGGALSDIAFAAANVPTPRVLTDWPRISHPVAAAPETERRIRDIVAHMSLEQKIGQMTQAEIKFITPEEVRHFYIGSVLNGGGSWPGGNKHASTGDWAALADRYYRASMTSDMAVPIPVIWGIDAVHGDNNVFGAVLYPHNIGLGAAHDPALIERIAHRTALDIRSTGIVWAFAPTLAVAQSPRWGRTYESYSSDPLLVRSYAFHFVRGMQGRLGAADSVLPTAKHFIGDGGTFLGKDQGETRAGRRAMLNIHAQGYFGALNAGVQTVMVSYSSWNDVAAGRNYGKMHGAGALVTGVLKRRLGFDGLVVSDWNAIEQVPGCSRAHCPAAINAGVDLVMVPEDWKAFIAATIEDVRAGVIPMSRIDDAVSRIIRVKMRAGLFAASPAEAVQPWDAAAGRTLAREAVRKSLVLLKNEKHALPLARDRKILVVGTGAVEIARQTGGWSISWQGDGNSNADFPNATSILDAIRNATSGQVDYSPDGLGVDVHKYDAVIAVASEQPYAEMKGDIVFPASLRHSVRYPADLAMLNVVSGRGVPVITVLLSGRPVYANDMINLSDAFVAAWLPGTEGDGVADGLFRDGQTRAAPRLRGRLPFAWPGTSCPDVPGRGMLFARGYGLSYARSHHLGTLPVELSTGGCAGPLR